MKKYKGTINGNPRISLSKAEIAAIQDGWPKDGTLVNFRGLRLDGRNLRGIEFDRCDLTSADMRGANLSGSLFDGCVVSFCCFSEANLGGSRFRNCLGKGADFSWALLGGASFIACSLHDALFFDASASGSIFDGSYLSRSNLCGASLMSASLKNCCLRDANISGSNLLRADLGGADLRGARLPSPTMMLLANWGSVSASLCARLMRFDMKNHPDVCRFYSWAEGGPCSMRGARVGRGAVFYENRNVFSDTFGRKPHNRTSNLTCIDGEPTPFALMVSVIREKCKDSDYHDKSNTNTVE